MDANALINHLTDNHRIAQGVARDVIAGVVDGEVQDEEYLRGFHDGMHRLVDADDPESRRHA